MRKVLKHRAGWDDVKGVGGVYALALPGTLAVKIGWSKDIHKRMLSARTSMPFEPVLLGVIRTTDQAAEFEAHRRIDAYRLRGEWFLWCDEVAAFIASDFECWPAFAHQDEFLAMPISGGQYSDEGYEFESALDSLHVAFNAMYPQAREQFCRACNDAHPPTVESMADMLGEGFKTGSGPARRLAMARLAKRLRLLGEVHLAINVESISGRLEYGMGHEHVSAPISA